MSSISEREQLKLAIDYQLITEQTNCILVHTRSAEDKATDLPELQKIAQMQAAGWGGAGTVHETVLHCMAPMQDSIQHSFNSAGLSDPSRSEKIDIQYDSPRVFRSSGSSHDESFSARYDRTQPDHEDEMHDIPAYLRRQVEEDQNAPVKQKPLSPRDVFAIANTNIPLSAFIQDVESKLLPDELKSVLHELQNTMSREEAWVIVLVWMLFKLDNDLNWSEEAKTRIEQLVNELDPRIFNAGLAVVNQEFEFIKPRHW